MLPTVEKISIGSGVCARQHRVGKLREKQFIIVAGNGSRRRRKLLMAAPCSGTLRTIVPHLCTNVTVSVDVERAASQGEHVAREMVVARARLLDKSKFATETLPAKLFGAVLTAFHCYESISATR